MRWINPLQIVLFEQWPLKLWTLFNLGKRFCFLHLLLTWRTLYTLFKNYSAHEDFTVLPRWSTEKLINFNEINRHTITFYRLHFLVKKNKIPILTQKILYGMQRWLYRCKQTNKRQYKKSLTNKASCASQRYHATKHRYKSVCVDTIVSNYLNRITAKQASLQFQ